MTVQRAREGIKRNAPLIMFMAALAAIVFILMQTRNQSKRNGRLSQQVLAQGRQIKAQGDAIERLAKVIDAQSKSNGAIGATVLANQQGIKMAAESAAASAKSSAEAITFLRNCFKPPDGECAKASAQSLQKIQQQLDAAAEQVTRGFQQSEFIVREIERDSQGNQQFRATPTCKSPVGIGDVEVGNGLLCATP